MLNTQNLKPLTTEKARKIGAKGGKASGESKRQRKLIKELVNDILDSKIESEELKRFAKKLGIKGDCSFLDLFINSILTRGIAKANMSDLQALQKIIGESEPDKLDMNGSVDVKIYLPKIRQTNEETLNKCDSKKG